VDKVKALEDLAGFYLATPFADWHRRKRS
jgi:hypothetical protein